MMTPASAKALSVWMLKNQPGVFATILKTHAKQHGMKLSGLGDDELQPVDVTAQYSDVELQPVDVTAQYSADLNPVNVTANYIDTSAANISTPGLLSTLGSDVSGAVSNVASFLLKGTAVLAPVAVAALRAQTANTAANAQARILATQASRAYAGAAPANIQYAANGTPVYVPTAQVAGGYTTMPAGLGATVTMPNGQVGYTLTPTALSNLSPSFFQKYGVWLIGGGAALALALILS